MSLLQRPRRYPSPSSSSINTASSSSIADLCMYFYETPYGEENVNLVEHIVTAYIISSQQQQQYNTTISLPWNVQWRIWCRTARQSQNNEDLLLFPLETIMAQLQACLLSQQQNDEQDDDDDLMPSMIMSSDDDDVNDDGARWENDCMLQDWNESTRYHVLRDLQNCWNKSLLSRQQQRDVQYILKCIDELVTRKRRGDDEKKEKHAGGEVLVSWDWASLLRVDDAGDNNDAAAASLVPKATVTMDEIMREWRYQRRRDKVKPEPSSGSILLDADDSPASVSPKFGTFVKACMHKSSTVVEKSGDIIDNDYLLELWDEVGRAPRDSTARNLLRRIRSLPTTQRQLLLDRIVQLGPPSMEKTHLRRGYAWIISALVVVDDATIVDASRVPFESLPSVVSERSWLESIENYLISSSLPDLNELAVALWNIVVHNPDSSDSVRDVMETVDRFREWLPSRPVFESCRAFLSDILSGETTGKEQASKVSAAVEMLCALSDEDDTDGVWNIIFDRDFCQGVLLPMRQRLVFALCVGQNMSILVEHSGFLHLVFERLLLEAGTRRRSILQACPIIAWVLYLFSELPLSLKDDLTTEITEMRKISKRMKRLYDLSFGSVGLEAYRAEDVFVFDDGNSVILLPPLESFIQSLVDVSHVSVVEDSSSIDAWTNYVINNELCWYDELADKLRSSWILWLVDSGKALPLVTRRLHLQFCRHYWESGTSKTDNLDILPLVEVFRRAFIGEQGGGTESMSRRKLLFSILQFTPSELLFANCPEGKLVSGAKGMLALIGVEQIDGASFILASLVSEAFQGNRQSNVKNQSRDTIYHFLKPASPAYIQSAKQYFDRIARQVSAILADRDSDDCLIWWSKLCNDIDRIEFPPSVHTTQGHLAVGCSEEAVPVLMTDNGRASDRKRPWSVSPGRGESQRRVRALFETVIRKVWGDKDSRTNSEVEPNPDTSREELSHDEYKDDDDNDDDRVLLL